MNNKIYTNSIFEELYMILSSEFKWYKVMLDLVKNEREAIVNDSVEDLFEISAEQEKTISAVKSLEEERKFLINELVVQYEIGLSCDKISMSQIAELAEEPYSSKYTKLQRRMRELLDEIHKINKRNLQMVRRSMDTFNTTIELLMSELNPAQIYSRSGLEKLESVNDSLLQRLGNAANYKA